VRGKIKQIYDKAHAQRCVMQLLIIAAAVAIDQISKHLIVSAMQPLETIPVIGSVFQLTYIQNTGASFGIFQGAQVFFLIATAVTLVVLGIYMVMARRKQTVWLRVSLSLVVAGAVGNFIDRIIFGYVRDFLDFSGLYFPWIFNVADSCLVAGSIMLGIYLLFMHKEKDGKPLLARRDRKRDILLEGDEDIDGEDAEEAQTESEAAGEKAEKRRE
jgi:lipoprotein signal peptidase